MLLLWRDSLRNGLQITEKKRRNLEEKGPRCGVISQRPGTKWLQCRFTLGWKRKKRKQTGFRLFLCSLRCAVTGHLCVLASKRADDVGLHGLVNQEEESSHDGQQEQLYPQRHAALHRFALTCRGSCRQKPGGGGGGGGEWGGGGVRGGGGQAGDSVDGAALCVGRGGAGCLGDFGREDAVLTVPQVTGLEWAAGCSSDGASTGGAAGHKDFTHELIGLWK